MQCKVFMHVQHQQYLNKAQNDGFFYNHPEYNIQIHFHLCLLMKTNRTHHQSRQRNARYITITGQSVEEHTVHWPHRYWWSCLLNGLAFLSWWWKSSYLYAHVWDLYCDIKYTAEKTALLSLVLTMFGGHAFDLNNTCLKIKREVAILFFFLFLFTLAFLFASDL